MEKLVTTAQFFKAYHLGEIDLHEAMEGVQAEDFHSFLDGMLQSGYSLRRGHGREAEVEREVAEALPMLREELQRADRVQAA